MKTMKKTLAVMLILSSTRFVVPAPAALSIYIFELDGNVVLYYRGSVNTSTAQYSLALSGFATGGWAFRVDRSNVRMSPAGTLLTFA